MPCDTMKVIEDEEPVVTENQIIQEKKQMSSTLVMRRMPEFEMEAYDAAIGHYTKISSEDLKGKWAVVCFYPADSTPGCTVQANAFNGEIQVRMIMMETFTYAKSLTLKLSRTSANNSRLMWLAFRAKMLRASRSLPRSLD